MQTSKKKIIKITKFYRTHNESLIKKENYITQTSSFYRLPKLHKSEKKKKTEIWKSEYVIISSPNDLKFRPHSSWPVMSINLSKPIDILLQPLVNFKKKGYLRDNIQFLTSIHLIISLKTTETR